MDADGDGDGGSALGVAHHRVKIKLDKVCEGVGCGSAQFFGKAFDELDNARVWRDVGAKLVALQCGYEVSPNCRSRWKGA